jgi:hypothetical protein
MRTPPETAEGIAQASRRSEESFLRCTCGTAGEAPPDDVGCNDARKESPEARIRGLVGRDIHLRRQQAGRLSVERDTTALRRAPRIAERARRLAQGVPYQEYAVPRPVEPEPGAGGRLGGFSDELGQIFLGEAGTSLTVPSDGDRQRPRPPSGGRRPSPSLRILEDGRLELLDGRRALRVDFTVVAIPGTVRSIVIASPSVILEGHQVETDPPAGVARPEVICWVGPDGRRHTGDRVIIPASDTGQWKTYVSVPADAAVAVQLDAVSGGTG